MTDHCPIHGEIEDPEFGCEPCNNMINHEDDIREDLRFFEELENGTD